ncbi:hypothetical protein HPP92_011106 [Vanilla planifolia]|uniref:Pectinesterase n=1 Tax=Vanilla planifolia TaxID=51239 RepID=A0A835V2I6_VANPL|nr:hypothetical protein HPP92_011106 [Vanilla planifolia]
MVCKEVLCFGIDDLQRTIDRYDSFNVAHADRILDDARTWLSGALTYQHTCLEAFDKSGSPAEIDIAKALNRSISFTANGLNVVSEMERMTSGLQLRRKLLASENAAGDTGLPRWVSFGRRRLLVSEIVEIKPNATVAQDGSGDYATITEALAAVPKKRGEAFVIYIKEGVYKEKVVVNRSLTNVVFIGDGPDKSKISGELNAVDGVKTFHTATFAVMGDGFMARDMGFENTAGAAKHQAVAVRVQSDMTIFHNCRMDGYQDTLYDFTYRHFYRDCAITGTVDFVFGNAKSVFQNCTLLLRRPSPASTMLSPPTPAATPTNPRRSFSITAP